MIQSRVAELFFELKNHPEFRAWLRKQVGPLRAFWYSIFPPVDAFSLQDVMNQVLNLEARAILLNEVGEVSPFTNEFQRAKTIGDSFDDCNKYILQGIQDGSFFKRMLKVKAMVEDSVTLTKKGGFQSSFADSSKPKMTGGEFFMRMTNEIRMEMIDQYQLNLRENSELIDLHIENGMELMNSASCYDYNLGVQADSKILVDSEVRMVEKFQEKYTQDSKEIERLLVYNDNKNLDPEGKGCFMSIEEGKELLKNVQEDLSTFGNKIKNFFKTVEEWKMELDELEGSSGGGSCKRPRHIDHPNEPKKVYPRPSSTFKPTKIQKPVKET